MAFNEFLRSGQVGTIELNEQKKVRTMIQERWDKLGMTEGLTYLQAVLKSAL